MKKNDDLDDGWFGKVDVGVDECIHDLHCLLNGVEIVFLGQKVGSCLGLHKF